MNESLGYKHTHTRPPDCSDSYSSKCPFLFFGWSLKSNED